jgi:glutathione S-transferase
MLTLYGVHRSRASRPIWLLHEIGLTFTHVPVIQAYRLSDAAAADAPFNTASPAFLKVNPMGQVPAMDDDGLVLTESLAICLHIARRHGGDLAPQGDRETAQAENWALFGASTLETPGIDILYTYAESLADTPDGAAKIAAGVAALARPMARLEAHFGAGNWLIGDRFTVADVMVAECLRYGSAHKPLMDAHPLTAAWLSRCQSRPAFQKMMTARLAEPA